MAGVLITALDVLIVLALQGRGFRLIEAFVITLIASIAACFAYEIFFAQPLWREAAAGFVPRLEILKNREMLYIAIGILGATVMPHNLYLHSSIVQTRAFATDTSGKREALRFAVFDSTLALTFALFINAAILILGAAAFHTRGLHDIAEISDAYKLLTPVLGASLASTLFACALLASGQNSTLTGTLAGQIVMEGFLNLRLKPWLRRLITRALAIIPAIIVIGIYGEGKVTSLLILSQVVLSFQLPFAVIPLVQFTSDKVRMGGFANSKLTAVVAWVVAIAIVVFNAELLYLTFRS
jgi:manganese transport protein